jgi:hypothetical protein
MFHIDAKSPGLSEIGNVFVTVYHLQTRFAGFHAGLTGVR